MAVPAYPELHTGQNYLVGGEVYRVVSITPDGENFDACLVLQPKVGAHKIMLVSEFLNQGPQLQGHS